jgi:hypothetical protein
LSVKIQDGGKPPSRRDFNGALNAVTQHTLWVEAGGLYQYDAALVAATGGYNASATILGADGRTVFISLANSNTTNPNTTPASIGTQWAIYGGGIKAYAGNPNGNVAGYAATSNATQPTLLWDITNSQLWVCTTTGTAGTAVWRTAGGDGIQYAGTSGGAANAQTLTPAVPLTAYVAGKAISFIAGFTNTGALTLNVSGVGVRNAFKKSNTGPVACVGGEINAGDLVVVIDDGTRWQIQDVQQVFGAVTNGHLAVFAGTTGRLQDGGLPFGIAPGRTYVDSAPGTLGPGQYNINTTAGAFACATMVAPTIGDSLLFADAAGTWGANNFTINFAGGINFTSNGFTGNQLVCNTLGLEFQIWYDGTNWRAS